jgi:hypothetical protein
LFIYKDYYINSLVFGYNGIYKVQLGEEGVMSTKQSSLVIITIMAALLLMGLSFATPAAAAPHKTPVPTSQTTPQPTAQSCYKPQAVNASISGYTEGISSGKGPNITGKEIVYNLVTFQRISFSTKETFYSSGRVLGSYVGYVQGFVVNQNAGTDYNTFTGQYATQFLLNTSDASTPIWSGFNGLAGRQGTSHFATAPDVSPAPIPVSGDQSFLNVSNAPFQTGQNGRSIYFFVNGSSKSYIVNCLVDITALVNDIKSGNSSSFQGTASVVQPWRDAAAAAAQSAAQDYNQRVTAGAG